MRILGIVLIVLGIVGLALGGVAWTERNEVLDLGAVEVATEERRAVPIPPLASVAAVIAGTVLVIAGGRRSRV